MAKTLRTANYSLRTRLSLSIALLLIVFLGLTGLVLDNSFRTSIEAGAVERLRVHIYLLLAGAEEDQGEFIFLADLREPRFGQLNSGLYGFISSPVRGELWRSDSARTLALTDATALEQPVATGETQFSKVTEAGGEELFLVSYGILWEDGISEYNFSVLESSAPYYSEISNFRASLWRWLGGVALLLTFMQLMMMRWGLSPLRHLADDLQKIESGEKQQLEGLYPLELRGVTDNLNILIQTERKQQDRYRTTLGDLAHSLKTPLAVMSGVIAGLVPGKTEKPLPDQDSSAESGQVDVLTEQLDRMNQIITYQLQRAVQTQASSSLARQVNVGEVLNRIVNALQKVYSEKSVICECDVDEQAIFYGDERDLMEIMGNILDNAFKYGNDRIWVQVSKIASERRAISLIVDDNGTGIAEDKRDFVLQRGARADTLARGQGIGMAVVTDIVSSYRGNIRLLDSPRGGARVEIIFEFDDES